MQNALFLHVPEIIELYDITTSPFPLLGYRHTKNRPAKTQGFGYRAYYGTWAKLDEFRAMMQFYGNDTVKKTMLNARWLDKVTLAFCSTIFDTPETAFRCYKLAQSNPEHWNY